MTPDVLWADAPLVLIDFETSGLDPERDRFVEVGFAFCRDRQLVGSVGWVVRREGLVIPEAVRQVHGITDEEIAAGVTPVDTLVWIIQHLDGHIPASYGVPFDRSFLVAEALRVFPALASAYTPPAFMSPAVPWIDPLVWARELQRYERGKKLAEVCSRLGISLDHGHRAQHDAVAAAQVLLRFADQLPPRYGDLCGAQEELRIKHEQERNARHTR